GGAHGDAEVSRGQGRGVVHAVAYHGHFVTLGFHGADKFDFVLRQTIAFGFFATDLGGDARGHGLTIAGNHGDAADIVLLEFGERFAGFGAGLVLETDPADALAVAGDENQAPAFGLVE